MGHIKGFDGASIENTLKNTSVKIKMDKLEKEKANLLKQLDNINNIINNHGRTK